MWRNIRFLHIVMLRNLELLHMWRYFRFLHICHAEKFEISPHDRFLPHGHRPCVLDKHEVWSSIPIVFYFTWINDRLLEQSFSRTNSKSWTDSGHSYISPKTKLLAKLFSTKECTICPSEIFEELNILFIYFEMCPFSATNCLLTLTALNHI